MKTFILTWVCFALALPIQLYSESLSQRQKRMSLFLLRQTSIGSQLVEELGGTDRFFDAFHIGDIETDLSPRLAQMDSISPFSFRVNGQILAASHNYFAWATAYALNQNRLAWVLTHHGAPGLPDFIELTQWNLFIASRFWLEAGFSSSSDFANHSNQRFADVAKSMKASSSLWAELLEQSVSGFLIKSKKAHLDLGRTPLSIHQFIERTKDPKQRAAAIELLQIIRKDIPEL